MIWYSPSPSCPPIIFLVSLITTDSCLLPFPLASWTYNLQLLLWAPLLSFHPGASSIYLLYSIDLALASMSRLFRLDLEAFSVPSTFFLLLILLVIFSLSFLPLCLFLGISSCLFGWSYLQMWAISHFFSVPSHVYHLFPVCLHLFIHPSKHVYLVARDIHYT